MVIRLTGIHAHRNRIQYEFERDTGLNKYFSNDTPFYIEYLDDSVDFTEVPKSVLAIPFVTNLLPLAWIYNLTIEVEELDESFYQSIDAVKLGFSKVYPNVVLAGDVCVGKCISNRYEPSENKVCLFSGGVDAAYTVLKHRKEQLTLVNVWGVDIALDDAAGHLEAEKHNVSTAEKFQCKYICVKSTLRTFLDESLLNREVYVILGDYWWHGAQHSIGLLSLLAPYNYLMKTQTNYIASSFTEKEFAMGVKCVSYPVVDSSVVFAGTNVYHDGFEANRSEKIKYICDVCKQENITIDLKVCFNFRDGKNCCHCEKCYRTMMDILVYDDDLENYGFRKLSRNAREIKAFLDVTEVQKYNWQPIQENVKKNPQNRHIRWFIKYKINNFHSFRSRARRLLLRMKK